MSDVYYVVGGVAYGILQFIISWVAGELDVDVTSTEMPISTLVMLFHLKVLFTS